MIMKDIIILAAFFLLFVAEGVFGVTLIWTDAANKAGPIILQGFGCAAAMGWYASDDVKSWWLNH